MCSAYVPKPDIPPATDSWEVKLFGRGAHGSAPQKSIDPIVMASSAVMRLQGIVSREVAMTDSAVVTVGTLRPPPPTQPIVSAPPQKPLDTNPVSK